MLPRSLLSLVAGVVLAHLVWKALGRMLRYSLTSKLTVLNDIPKLGGGTKRRKKIPGTAVVCGGSIAGLWTARICAEHFEKVLVIEPEMWVGPDAKHDTEEFVSLHAKDQDGIRTVGNKRTRVSHYHGIHTYQTIALDALRKLFPNADAEARAMGILIRPLNLHIHVGGLPIRAPYWDYPTDLPEGIISTRPYFEALLRKLVRGSPDCANVEFLLGTVTGVVPLTNDPSRIGGVHVRLGNQNEPRIISGELFIDCTGGTQGFFKWLARVGYGSGVDAKGQHFQLSDLRRTYQHKATGTNLQYFLTPEMQARLSARFPGRKGGASESDGLPEGWDNAGWLFVVSAVPEIIDRGMMCKKNGADRVELAFGGWAVADLPRTNAEIMDYMDHLKFLPGYGLPTWIREFVTMLAGPGQPEPVVSIHSSPPSSAIDYHKAKNLPSNFVAIGDSAMLLNSAFGQGCSKAMIGAVTLNTVLNTVHGDSLSSGFGKKFFDLQHSRTNNFWVSTKNRDYRVQTTKPVAGEEKEYEKSLQTQGGLRAKFEFNLVKLTLKDQYVASALWHASSMLAPPTDLFAPKILVKLAWAKLSGSI